jgi:hypothetical protein
VVTIKVLEKFSIGNTAYYEGETRVVEEEVAQTACGAGWAQDVSGGIPTGERDPSGQKLVLVVQKLSHPTGSTTPGE